MIRTFSLVGLAAIAAALAACSSKDTAPSDTALACTAGDQCRACGSCLETCLCGGGTEARCTLECSEAPPGGNANDAGTVKSSLSGTFISDAFDIPAGVEIVKCQSFPNPFGKDVVLTRVESYMTAGSHHMFVFVTPGGDGPKSELADCGGLMFGPNLHLSQRSHDVTTYPPGVGRVFNANQGVQLQIHYFNASEDEVKTEIAVTLYAEEPDALPIKAGQIFINTGGIYVPPFSEGSAKKRCPIGKDLNLFTASSHMHQHGVNYVARASDGQLLYETKEWAEPPPWRFETPRKLKAGSFIEIQCDYRNDTPFPLKFGESANTDEMCIFVGAYYPWEPGDDLAAFACLL